MGTRIFVSATVVRLTRPAFHLLLLGTLLALSAPAMAVGEDDQFWTVYDSKSDHPWNRVFRALYDTTLHADEKAEGWPASLLHGQRHKDTIAALDHFLNTRAERLVREPVKRALFQNDLWKFFNWTLPRVGTADYGSALVALRQKLVRIMRRVALTRAEIKNLPDTYAATIGTRNHPVAYDPVNRQKAFLPPDLWEDNGPWVLLGNNWEGKPAAILHAQQLGGASDFFVFLSLPGGRDDTVHLLDQLRILDYLRVEQQFRNLKRQGIGLEFAPDLPRHDAEKLGTWLNALPPIGTRVALVRQMRVLSTSGYDYPSRIIESVQIRVYRDPDQPPQFPPAPDDTRFHTTEPVLSQDVYVIRLDRRALAAGAPNSLRSVTVGEYTRNANFINGTPPPAEIRPASAAPPLKAQATRVVDSCAMCHGQPNLFSFMTFSRALMNGETLPKLHARKRKHEEGSGRRLQQYRIGYLQALWETVRD